ncbi:MAG: hypothetical protein JWQ44_2002 [Chthoniobacter sp.]|nr:hypothetical protein [Chthoniobacter sp.]
MILVLVAGLVLLHESRQDPLESWDNSWADFLAMNSRRGQQPAPVALVGINDESLRNHPWPWNPLDFSLFFQAALPNQPGVVAIDEVLDWSRLALPDDQVRKLPQYEKILRDNLLRAPKILLGAQLGFPDDPQLAPPWQEVPLLRNVKGDLSKVQEFPMVERQPTDDYRLASTVGFTNLPPSGDRLNSVPLVFRLRGQVTPAFPLQAVMLWSQLTPDDVAVYLGSHIQLGPRRIPIDARGQMRVDFGTPRTDYSFDELLLATEQVQAKSAPVVDLGKIKGSILLLSRTDKEARTIPLAARRNGSPGELFAAAIATIQNRSFIHRSPLWAQCLVLLGLVLVSYRVPRWKRSTTLLAGALTVAIYVMISMAVFNRWQTWLPGVMPVGVVLFFTIFRIATPDAVGKPKRPIIL